MININKIWKSLISDYKVTFVLYLLGFLLCIYASIYHKVELIELNNSLGIFGKLPLIFYLGFLIMIVTLISKIKTDPNKVFLLKSFILFILIWNIPTFFENNFSVWDSIMHFENSLMNRGLMHSTIWSWNSYFKDWPGFFYFGYYLFKISSLEIINFLKAYRLFISIFTFISLYLFLKQFSKNEKEYRYALLISIMFIVWHQFHYSPQSVGFPIALLILSYFRSKKPLYKILTLTLGLILAITHPVNFIILIFVLGFWFSLNLIIHKFKKPSNFNIYLAVIIFFIIWSIFNSTSLTKTQIEKQSSLFESKVNLFDIIKDRLYNTPLYRIKKFDTFQSTIKEKQINNISTKIISVSTKPPESPIIENITSISALEKKHYSWLNTNLNSYTKDPFLYSEHIRIISFIFVVLINIIFLFLIIYKKLSLNDNLIILSFIFGVLISFILSEILGISDWEDRFLIYLFLFTSLILVRIIKILHNKFFKILVIIFAVSIIFLNFSTIYSKESGNLIGNEIINAGSYISNNYNDYCKLNNFNDDKINRLCYIDIFHYDNLKNWREYVLLDNYREVYLRSYNFKLNNLNKYYVSDNVAIYYKNYYLLAQR